MLCPACEALRLSFDLSQNHELLFHPSINSLQSSSESRCHMCRMIYTNFCSKFQNELVSRNCEVLVKTVVNTGFWVSFKYPQEEKSLESMANFDVAVLISHFDLPSKPSCEMHPPPGS